MYNGIYRHKALETYGDFFEQTTEKCYYLKKFYPFGAGTPSFTSQFDEPQL